MMALAFEVHPAGTVSVYDGDDPRCSVELDESDLIVLIDALREAMMPHD